MMAAVNLDRAHADTDFILPSDQPKLARIHFAMNAISPVDVGMEPPRKVQAPDFGGKRDPLGHLPRGSLGKPRSTIEAVEIDG